MAVRLAALLPRAVIVALVWILGTAAFTLAADNTIVGSSSSNPSAAAAAAQTELVVPSVSGQAYVFAKGILEDSGFAWRIVGSVRGYSSNRVLTQSPAAGTRVVDTGAPTVIVRLVRGPYAQLGRPIDTSPYRGTAIRLAGLASARTPAAKPTPKPKLAPKPAPKPAAKPKPVTKTTAKPAVKTTAKPAARPPAFVLAGAPKEPLDEISLPARALRLQRWVTNRPKTGANVRHWLYQHAWLVTGAQFGWWHGSQALQTLIAVDQQVERQWGIGAKSEAVARAALGQVRRRAR
ncbi:MAG TPA: PASTA domain-containing protein [Gaiellaceae bacterium]|nr:PASTA domain-containing protein [Gaiellaceae bacterium]